MDAVWSKKMSAVRGAEYFGADEWIGDATKREMLVIVHGTFVCGSVRVNVDGDRSDSVTVSTFAAVGDGTFFDMDAMDRGEDVVFVSRDVAIAESMRRAECAK